MLVIDRITDKVKAKKKYINAAVSKYIAENVYRPV